MNKFGIILALSLCVSAYSCKENNKSTEVIGKIQNSKPLNVNIISDTTKDGSIIAVRKLGTLQQGEVVEIKIDIESGFNTPFIISKINTSCGCAQVQYDNSPIKPNEQRSLDVQYNSFNRLGTQFANVTLVTNKGEFVVRLETFIKN